MQSITFAVSKSKKLASCNFSEVGTWWWRGYFGIAPTRSVWSGFEPMGTFGVAIIRQHNARVLHVPNGNLQLTATKESNNTITVWYFAHRSLATLAHYSRAMVYTVDNVDTLPNFLLWTPPLHENGNHTEDEGRERKQAVRGGRHNMPPPLWPWPFDLENGVRVTCDVGYLCAIFTLPIGASLFST